MPSAVIALRERGEAEKLGWRRHRAVAQDFEEQRPHVAEPFAEAVPVADDVGALRCERRVQEQRRATRLP